MTLQAFQNEDPLMRAFQNKDSLKQEVITRMKEHVKADQLVQGMGWNDNTKSGCGVACTIDCYSHVTFAKKLGLDLWIPMLYDKLHEGIDAKVYAKFDVAFLESIPTGMTKRQSDLVMLKLLHFVLTKIIPSKFQKHKEIKAIISLFKLSIQGITVTTKQWRNAADDIRRERNFASAPASSYASSYASSFASPFAFAYYSACCSAYYSIPFYAPSPTSPSDHSSVYSSSPSYDYALSSAYPSLYDYTLSSHYSSADSSTSSSKKRTMLKIGNKLIELFKET